MFKKMIFPQGKRKICGLCAKAVWMKKGEKLLCARRGVVEADERCLWFRYDPLKREPAKTPPLEPVEKEKMMI